LLYRLQTEHPGEYPDVLVRTVQHRLKNWRSALALALVFGRDRASNRSRVTTISRARRDAGNLPGLGRQNASPRVTDKHLRVNILIS
jgi:hypothetical protein